MRKTKFKKGVIIISTFIILILSIGMISATSIDSGNSLSDSSGIDSDSVSTTSDINSDDSDNIGEGEVSDASDNMSDVSGNVGDGEVSDASDNLSSANNTNEEIQNDGEKTLAELQALIDSSTENDVIELSGTYSGNDVLKAYHLGTNNGNYCVTSTDLSYSYSNGTDGYTNNFITVLYPQIADYSNDSTKEKASISNLTVTPNRYYKLNYGNYLDSIDSVDISPIKLVAEDITYNWTAPVESEAPAEATEEESPTPKVFGYIRIYQKGNGYSVDIPVTYEMITVLANASLIDTDYVEPEK